MAKPVSRGSKRGKVQLSLYRSVADEHLRTGVSMQWLVENEPDGVF